MFNNTHEHMLAAIEAARRAREKGNHPFGAVLVGPEGEILLEAENTVNSDRDPTAHAETNLVRKAAKLHDPAFLSTCTLYASTEPCPMCAAAIFWANIGRVVFGLSQESLYGLIGADAGDRLQLSCREVLARGGRSIKVLGPMMEEQAQIVHLGFWKK